MPRLRTFALLVLLVVTAIGVVLTRHASRSQFTHLQQLEAGRDQLNIEWGRLQLEQATWAEANRIEQHARSTLGLVEKPPEQVVVIVR